MRSSTSSRRTAPAVASPEEYLTGLAPRDGGSDPPGPQPGTTTHSGWWVRRSAAQILDAAGQAVGFRHELMRGRKSIKSGVGADCARTFRQQAEFLNAKDGVDLSRSEERADVTTENDEPVTTSRLM